jgi:hypothetical protein
VAVAQAAFQSWGQTSPLRRVGGHDYSRTRQSIHRCSR